MVLAAHRTRVHGITVVTVETVQFTAPKRVDFASFADRVEPTSSSASSSASRPRPRCRTKASSAPTFWWLGR